MDSDMLDDEYRVMQRERRLFNGPGFFCSVIEIPLDDFRGWAQAQ